MLLAPEVGLSINIPLGKELLMSMNRQAGVANKALWRRTMVAGAVGLLVASSAVYAQQVAGSITGSGAPGDVVTIEGKAIGINRTVKVGTDGGYAVSQLPAGSYVVTVTRANGTKKTVNVEVQSGAGAVANFAEDLQRIVVTGSAVKSIDTKSTETTQLLTRAELDRIPVAKNVTAIALLAPGATQGDSRLGGNALRSGNIASLGGASPAENTYYINGFNVTNIVNGVAFNQIPSAAVLSQEVKTGGYGAEYGRSLGGVLSVVTKRGTNEWTGGASIEITPESMMGSSVYPEKNASGKWVLKDRPGGTDSKIYNLWAGGPIVEDKLFVFGVFQGSDIVAKSYGANTQTEITTNTPQYLVKFDWNLTDSHRLELTSFSDKTTDKSKDWESTEAYGTAKGAYKGPSEVTAGGANHILQYTGSITDDFTLKALYGIGKYDRSSALAGADCPIVQDRRTSTILSLGCWTGTTITDPAANDKRTAWRIDAEYVLGAHTLRAGLDNEKYEVVDGTSYSGGGLYQVRVLNPGQTLANGYSNTSGTAMEYVRFRKFANGGTFTTKNSAWYIEDSFQATKDVLLTLGLRNESFENLNADGKSFIKIDNTWAPRLGAAWDVFGNADLKLLGNIGRYYIPVYANTNVRLSGQETDYQEFYAFGGSFGTDGKSVPTLGTQLGSRATTSDGQTPDPRSVVDPNIKPMYQDEIMVGLEKALGDRWVVGAKYIHRALKSSMDDMCNDEGAYNWAIAEGYTSAQADEVAAAIGHCFLYNPGGDLTANVDLDATGTLTKLTIPAAALGMPKPKRTYDALQLTLERSWDKQWMVRGSYVLSFSKGNTEGYVKSDIGQDDAGISQDFDYPGLMEGADGYLPNDRRHTFKVFGAYAVNDEWRLGANFILQSGRPKNCFGVYGGTTDGVSQLYGDASFWCDGKLNPRGSFGRLPWTNELSLQANYAPAWQKGLSFSVDVLNIFDKRGVRGIEEGEDQGINDPDSIYGRPITTSLQRPRTVKFTAQYEF
ncbi:TonB-dependent receptor [Ideonella sp.]|uniref:TonB-dependent receptor n=1 Tax=Ideonella sp. TaxID=1929293 RepID=UPI003BB7A7D3